MLLEINAYRIVVVKDAVLQKCGIPLLYAYMKVI